MGAVPSCYTCTSEYDHNGAALPFNDPGCFDEASIDFLYSRECLNEDDICLVDVEVDWFVDGQQTVNLRRGCGKAEDVIEGGCSGNYNLFPTPMQLYKDCNAMCDPSNGGNDNCNGFDLFQTVMNLHDSGNELSCHSCSYVDANGIVNGDTKCIQGDPSIPTRVCPQYANAACFTAALWTDDVINSNLVTNEQDHRGCSGFNFQSLSADCQAGTNGPDGHFAECKYTCNEPNCNTNKLEKRKSCITCEGTRASDNSTVGLGDDNCWDLMGSINSVECHAEDDICIVEMEVDWLPNGMQQA